MNAETRPEDPRERPGGMRIPRWWSASGEVYRSGFSIGNIADEDGPVMAGDVVGDPGGGSKVGGGSGSPEEGSYCQPQS
jgi:hypothetical protein